MHTVARTFTPADVQAFAAASGDWNPAHVDPLAARRLIAGGPIVHGVHALLWALDGPGESGLARIRCSFRQPVRVGERASARLLAAADGTLAIAMEAGGRDALEATIEWASAGATDRTFRRHRAGRAGPADGGRAGVRARVRSTSRAAT